MLLSFENITPKETGGLPDLKVILRCFPPGREVRMLGSFGRVGAIFAAGVCQPPCTHTCYLDTMRGGGDIRVRATEKDKTQGEVMCPIVLFFFLDIRMAHVKQVDGFNREEDSQEGVGGTDAAAGYGGDLDAEAYAEAMHQWGEYGTGPYPSDDGTGWLAVSACVAGISVCLPLTLVNPSL